MIQGWDLYPHLVAFAPRTPGYGFHTVGGGIDPEDHLFVLDLLELSL